jgi:glycerol-3-phosphate O-acyltransferase
MSRIASAPAVVAPHDSHWPPPPDAPAVVLALADTPVERQVLDEFAARLGAEIRVTDDAESALQAATVANAPIAPVGVAWLPPERDGGRRFALRDLLVLSDPSRPRERAQRRILHRAPERCRVVVGESATPGELRERWERHSGEGDFAAFIDRQARLAVDRAERSLLGARYKTAQHIVDDLMESRSFREGAEQLAATLARSRDDVLAEARECLVEMASVQNRFARDVWAQMSKFLWGRAYELEVDQEGLENLRALNKLYPLVFLPSHKSNLDGFVMSSVTYESGFPANHIVGGINMGFWPLGMLGRRVGVVWIRRSFGGNEVYKYALRRYLAHVASKRFNLEWYIEGGRSRTGKLLAPRMGLLNYLATGVEEAGIEEVLLVPVSIVYDRLNEVVEMTAQSRGAVKRPEGLGWLLRYARSQRGPLGRVQVRFGEPVPLRTALADAGEDPAARRLALSKVAFEVSTRINRATPVTPISLATLALLGTDGHAVTLAQAHAAIGPLRSYVSQRALPGSDTLVALASEDGVGRVLRTLVEHGVVDEFDGGPEPVYRIGAERDLAAAFYRNVVIHWFVNRAIVELALVTAATETLPDDDAMADALEEAFRLRDLLKFEFFFAEKGEFQDELRAEMALIDPAWLEKGGAGLQTLGEALAASGGLIADRVLRSFLEAYYIVADRLDARGLAAVDESALIRECLRLGRQYHLQGRIVSAEAVSSELFKTGLKLARNRGLLDGGGTYVAARRCAFKGELHDVLRRLEILAGWNAARRPRREGER